MFPAVGLVASALAMSATCSSGPCINVYTDPLTHQIIITAHQNRSASRSTPTPIATPAVVKPIPRSAPRFTPRPIPRVTHTYLAVRAPAQHTTLARKPRTPKPPFTASASTTGINLSDQISQLLPGSRLLYQPVAMPLARVPIYFWSDAGRLFAIATSILGIGVNVALTPTFTWNFGDGATLTTSTPGGAFPDGTTTHTYQSAGRYSVNLAISWVGNWSSQGSTQPLLGGAIVQNLSTDISICPAPTNYTG